MQLDCCFVFHIENIFLNVTRFSTTAQNVGAPYQVGVWCRHVGCVDGRKVNNTGRITSGNMKFILTKFFWTSIIFFRYVWDKVESLSTSPWCWGWVPLYQPLMSESLCTSPWWWGWVRLYQPLMMRVSPFVPAPDDEVSAFVPAPDEGEFLCASPWWWWVPLYHPLILRGVPFYHPLMMRVSPFLPAPDDDGESLCTSPWW